MNEIGTDISIIIPTKDRLWALPKAILSCRSSSLRVQIIVVDDGSRDGTSEWLMSQRDITVLRGEGWGKPWAVNKALHSATGKYVRYLDSDDWLNPCANETQFEIAERSGADLVVAGMDEYRDEKLIQVRLWVSTDDLIAQQLGESFGSHYSAFLFRRDFITDIPHRTLFPSSDFASRDDRCFMLEVALRHPVIAVCGGTTLCHRHHSKGRLQFQGGLRRSGTNIQHLYIYRQILDLLAQRDELSSRRIAAAVKILWPLAHWIAYSHPEEGAAVAEWIRRLEPGFKAPEPGLLGALYRNIGFSRTESLLALRRVMLGVIRRSSTRRER